MFGLQPLQGTKVKNLEPQVKTFGFAADLLCAKGSGLRGWQTIAPRLCPCCLCPGPAAAPERGRERSRPHQHCSGHWVVMAVLEFGLESIFFLPSLPRCSQAAISARSVMWRKGRGPLRGTQSILCGEDLGKHKALGGFAGSTFLDSTCPGVRLRTLQLTTTVWSQHGQDSIFCIKWKECPILPRSGLFSPSLSDISGLAG